MISQIGKYTVESELGSGGFGRVYKAWDPELRQSVAIKVLLAEGDPDLLKRFRLEVVTTASLHHKNIVTIYASGEEGGTPYLVMELLEGKTLGQIIKERIPLSLMEKVRIMTQVAEGLTYAHSKGVVHRDIKPPNIMLQPDGSVKIMDFGIALASNRRTMNMTMTGFVIGTVPYMAPEQFTDGKANEQTDIFSFGDVFYELLTGSHPFQPFMRDLSTLHMAINSHEPQAVSQLAPECPESLELIIHRSLAKEPEFRYQSFEELRLDSASVLVDLQHEQAAAILRDVPALLAAANLSEARAKVREAQQLDPGNRQGRQLLEAIDQQLQEKVTRKRVAKGLSEAEKHLAERRFAEAVQALETAAKFDTGNTAVQMRLAEAKAKLSGSVEARRLMEDARARQQRGGLSEALERLDRAIEIDPEHTEARRLREKVSQQFSRRQRDESRQQAMQAASERLGEKQFAEALGILDRLEGDQAGDTAVTSLRDEIERQWAEEKRRLQAERFQVALAKTRETMQAGELERAGQMLAHLNTHFASDPGVADVLMLLRGQLDALLRAREISACRQRANDLLKQKSFHEASEVLAEALRQYPDDTGLTRIKASADALYESYQRTEAIAAVLKRSNSLRDAGDLQGALAALAEGRKRLGDEAALADLAQQFEMELETYRYAAGLEDLLGNVRSLIAAGKYAEAVEQIARADEYGAETEVRTLLDSARMAAGNQEEQRFVADSLAAAANLRAQQDWKRAVSTLEAARLRYPQNLALSQTLDRFCDEIENERRRAAIERHRAAINREIEVRAWKIADATVRQALEEFPNERMFHELAERIQAGSRDEALEEAAAGIRAKLAANNLPEAMQLLDATQAVFALDSRWKELQAQIEQRRAYEAELAEAEQHRLEGSPAKVAPVPETVRETVRETVPEAVPERIELAVTPAPKRIPWKLAGAGAGVAVLVAAGLLVPKLLRKQEVPISTIPVEIRTDPPGTPVSLPPPAPKEGQPTVAIGTGTLLVQAGVPDALVYVDGTARSRTDKSGSLSLSLEARAHEVRVERNGYATPAPKKVAIAEGARRSVVFSLSPQAARLELRGAPSGVEVRAGGKPLGVTNGSADFLFPSSVTPGDQTLQVTLGSASRAIQQRFDPGQTAHLEWKDVMPAAPVTAPPNTEVLERQQWDRVRATADFEQLRAFVRSYPNSPHAKEAETRIADLQWGAVDQTNLEAIRRFLKDRPDNPHRAEGQRIVDQLEEHARLAEQARQESARKQELARQEASAKQDQLRRHQAFEAVNQFDTALQNRRARDVKAIWPGVSQLFLDAMGVSGVKLSLKAREEDVRFLDSDHATVQGTLVRNVNRSTNTQKAILMLRNRGGSWIVESAKFE